MSFLDRVLHKHKAKSTAELVSRAVTALDKLEVDDFVGGGPSSASAGGGDRGGGSGSGGMQSEHDRSREEVARALSAMKVRRMLCLFLACARGAFGENREGERGRERRNPSFFRHRAPNHLSTSRPRQKKKNSFNKKRPPSTATATPASPPRRPPSPSRQTPAPPPFPTASSTSSRPWTSRPARTPPRSAAPSSGCSSRPRTPGW